MNEKKVSLSDTLSEYATYLELDGQDAKAQAYDRAARSIRTANYLPPDPSQIDGIGETIRTTIAKYQRSGEIAELEELKEKYDWFEDLRKVDHLGPSRAEDVHFKFRVSSIDDLLMIGDDLTMINGIGEKTKNKIMESAREVNK